MGQQHDEHDFDLSQPPSATMLFKNLHASAALRLESYSNLDHFHESERYAGAESIPLSTKNFSVVRANLVLPSCTLSLVRTFPRIINGFSGRILIVVPMDGSASTRLNGREVGQSLIMTAGRTNCTVVEPERRLVAILSICPGKLGQKWQDVDQGHVLLRLPSNELLRLQSFIRQTLEFAAVGPETIAATESLRTIEQSVLLAFGEAVSAGAFHDGPATVALTRYRMIMDQVDHLLGLNPFLSTNEELAEEIGVSIRTLQTASQALRGLAVHRYSRLRRLWSVRRHLKTGATGLTVKASALAHGFSHISEFVKAYVASFGELPSDTLARARFGDSLVGYHSQRSLRFASRSTELA